MQSLTKVSRNFRSNTGYRSWFQPFRFNQRKSLSIFVLDFETHSFREEEFEDSFDFEEGMTQARTKLVNGIQIYFLDSKHQKHRAFLRHEPYFYLQLQEGLTPREISRIKNLIYEMGDNKVIRVEEGKYYDAAKLTFLVKETFLKITVDRPGSVPSLRSKFEEIQGIIEWREADVLFHHRVAIDHNVRVGSWYSTEISGGEIRDLKLIPNKAPPELRILAFDIETDFDLTREPHPNNDEVSMISFFTGNKTNNGNTLIINSNVVDTKNIQNFDIHLRKSNKDHSKPWVDWSLKTDTIDPLEVIESYPINIVITRNEKELLQLFYQNIMEYKPDVLCSFFGGRFDIPFLAVRSQKIGIDLEKETGFRILLKGSQSKNQRIDRVYSPNAFDYVTGAGIIHLDAYLFNEKYSYLPIAQRGLKISVEKKLKVIPIGREALFAIKEDPAAAVAYAGCDGYITYKYVKEIVLDFFISMGKMFPVSASELLTRNSGSLDDLLIDAEDYRHQIVGRRRIGQKEIESFSSGVVIESLAYTGGLVEARRPGIFRSDIFYDYEPNKKALINLKETIKNIILKETKTLVKKTKKEEFEHILGSELGEINIEFSEDPNLYLKKVEAELIRNGSLKDDVTFHRDTIQKILEKTSSLYALEVDQTINVICDQIDQLVALEEQTQLQGVHVDVTSMYPSQIRQYKLQPSGIVPLTMCRTCDLNESNGSCYFEGDWVIKLSAHRPCRFKTEGSKKCDVTICTSQDESNCKKYEPQLDGISRSQEVFTFDGKKTIAYKLKKNSELEPVPINSTYLGTNILQDPFVAVQQWLLNSVEATQLTTKLDQNHFDHFEDQSKGVQLPSNSFISLDVRTKKITVLLSVKSRVCQKSYSHIARIMDDFFNTRVKHKYEAQRLRQVISQKRVKNQPVSSDLLQQQKFHDSTQLGMKVPLNSVYGLLGMKGGVRNASTPCAGITTKLSADLIYWAANQLEEIGLVAELDTDGVWLWVPKLFPLNFPVKIAIPYKENSVKEIKVSLIDKILNEKVDTAGFRNENYWINDGTKISRTTKSLIRFEQDGPYDFQFIMGKKKYIVYNFNKNTNEWIEKELIGLETKRADFSQLQKYYQEEIIKSYLEQYDPNSPLTLSQLYQNAERTSDKIRNEMTNGELDPSYFVKPKAINKPLNAYKSKLPQVSAAYILRDLGFSVGPGTRIQMLNIKGNQVIPRQIFDFDFRKIKEVLIKHAICTLSFMVGDISSKNDLHKLIDIPQYLSDIFGPGRIYERMVRFPMENQQLLSKTHLELDIGNLKERSTAKVSSETTEKLPTTKEMKKKKPKKSRRPRKKISRSHLDDHESSLSKQKMKTQSLEGLLISETPSKSPDKRKSTKKLKKEKKIKDSRGKSTAVVLESTEQIGDDLIKEIEKSPDSMTLISSEELNELESSELFTNGVNSDNDLLTSNEEFTEAEIFCSECGALINLNELTIEGCLHCGGRKISP